MSVLHFVINYIHFDKPGLIKPKDDLRISFTSYPNHQKGNFVISASKSSFINKELTIGFDQFVKEILIIIRRKSFMNGDPILGKVLFLTETIPDCQEIEKDLDILDVSVEGNQGQVRKVGNIGIRAYIDCCTDSKSKIVSSYSMPSLSDIPAYDAMPSEESAMGSFFHNLASKFKKNKNFAEIDGGTPGFISSSKSEFVFIDTSLVE